MVVHVAMCIAKILVESNFHRKPIINFHSIIFMRQEVFGLAFHELFEKVTDGDLSRHIWTPEIFGPPLQTLKTNPAIQTLGTNPANHSYPEPSP